MTTTKTCGGCRHFIKSERELGIGLCHFNPPSAVSVLAVVAGNLTSQIAQARPPVKPTDPACAQFSDVAKA